MVPKYDASRQVGFVTSVAEQPVALNRPAMACRFAWCGRSAEGYCDGRIWLAGDLGGFKAGDQVLSFRGNRLRTMLDAPGAFGARGETTFLCSVKGQTPLLLKVTRATGSAWELRRLDEGEPGTAT
jgi:hypothetical protein